MKRIVLCLVLLCVRAQEADAQQAQPLEKYLNHDGTLNTPHGFSGSLDPKGWKLQTTSSGAPRFVPASAMSNPADTAWDVNFFSGDLQINGDVRAIAVIGNDVYIGGAFTSVVGVAVNHIVRWNGFAWYPLGNGVNAAVYALAVSGLGLYVGGDFSSPSNNVAKWDGYNWFALGSGTDGTVYSLASDGSSVYAGGLFSNAGGVTAGRVARWNGSSWSALGTGANATVTALAVSGTDLYAGGYFSTAGGVTVNQIARWDGSAWHSLAGGLDGNVSAIAVSGSNVYVGGGFGMAGSVAASNIARWDGTKWDSLGSGVNGTVYALAVNGSNIYAGGDFNFAGNSAASKAAEWTGSSWSSLGSGVNNTVRALASNGTTLFAGGYFTVAGTDSATRVAKWGGNTWSPLRMGVDGGIYTIALSGSDLYVAGSFTQAGGVAANNIAKWNGTSWSALGSGIPTIWHDPILHTAYASYVNCLAVDGANVYAGGVFDTAGSSRAMGIAKWNGSGWSALGGGFQSGGYPGSVFALAVSGTNLFAGSSLTNPGYVAKWNGSSWSGLGGGVDGQVYALALHDTDLYVGGSFVHAGGISSPHVAKWDGSTWSALGTGTDSGVGALSIDGKNIYAGGTFNHAGGIAASRLAKWNGLNWSAVGPGVSGGFSCGACTPNYFPPGVGELVIYASALFAGGMFDSAGTMPIKSVAEWDGSGWSELGSGLTPWPPSPGFPYELPPQVFSLAVGSGYLYVAGSFPSAGGKACNGLARWKIPPPSRTFAIDPGWNLVSTPVIPLDDSVHVLFPGSSGRAFAFTPGGYSIQPTISQGNGYWLRYPGSTSVTISGTLVNSDTLTVSAGWNLIGSISQPIGTSTITSDPPGMITSRFFRYSGGYVPSDSIKPGNGYWVKVNQNGLLIYSPPGSTNPNQSIHIVPTPELPPPPPEPRIPASTPLTPDRFALDQNYPNPFNPSTVIRYSLPVQSHVALRIYNVLGQELKTLIEEPQDAGYKSVSWDAADLGSGIYFYKLTAGSFIDVKKMVLIR